MPSQKKQKNILITGAARGIGESILNVLCNEGYCIYGIYNTSQKSAIEIQKKSPNTKLFKVDLSNKSQTLAFSKKIQNQKLHAIVNVAGIAQEEHISNLDLLSWERTMQVNLYSPLLLIQSLVDNLEKGGSIVNIASLFGSTYGMNMSISYSASKAALINVTKTLAYQLKDKHIRVNAIAPSIVDTDMTALDTKEMLDEVSRRTPVGRIARPEEIANIVSFLISDKASYINAHTIVADGGYSCWDGIY